MPSDKRLQFPRIQTNKNTALGKIIDYLTEYPIDFEHLQKEFLYHTFLVRALSHQRSREKQQTHITQEAWRSIWHHWGTIESICAASGISIKEVIARLGGAKEISSREAEGDQISLKGMKISDFAGLVEDLNSSEEKSVDSSESINAFGAEEAERIDDISDVFGA